LQYQLQINYENPISETPGNGHLPDVPSETEVSENGLSLGESYGTLLRKIEELTLYVIDLKKENEELRKMIEEKNPINTKNLKAMKTKLIKNIFALALILLSVVGCSKFDDGPKISFRSVMKRIYGTYRVEYISKNGEDLTNYWKSYYDLSFKIYSPYYERPDDSPSLEVSGFIECNDSLISYATGYQTFIQIDKNVYIPMYNYMIDTALYPGRHFYPLLITTEEGGVMFRVTRLTDDEMWLYLNDGSDEYIIKFKE